MTLRPFVAALVFSLAACGGGGGGVDDSECVARCETTDAAGCDNGATLVACKDNCAKDAANATAKNCGVSYNDMNSACDGVPACTFSQNCTNATATFRSCAYGPFGTP